MIYVLIGLASVAALGAVLPFGSLRTALNADDKYAPLTMLGVGVPAYATPMTAMMQIGSMFHHGNSVGAAFVLLTIGAGTNLGLLSWVAVNYGCRRAGTWLLLIIGIVLTLSYVIDHPLRDISAVNVQHVKDHPHTHAFDIYCQPFPASAPVDMAAAARKLGSRILPHEIVSALTIGILVLAGLVIRRLEQRVAIEDWLASASRQTNLSVPNIWTQPLSPTVLGGVALLGVVVVSILGCYVYYPAPEVVLEDLKLARVEVCAAALTMDHEAAEESIDWAADLTRRLEVGVYIRSFQLDDRCRATSKTIRDLLEQLDHAVEENQPSHRVRELTFALANACSECREAYLLHDKAN